MGTRERRERALADTRQLILDAARDTFVELGYEATTMRAIADRIEYTPTALYHHFDSKESLLVELCSVDFESLAAAFGRIGLVDDPLERLRRIGLAYVDFALEHSMQYSMLFLSKHPNADGAEKEARRGDPGADAYVFLRQTCADVIATGRLRAEFADADELAQMVWASLHGLLALHIVKRNGGDWIEWRNARQVATKICDVMIRGLSKE